MIFCVSKSREKISDLNNIQTSCVKRCYVKHEGSLGSWDCHSEVLFLTVDVAGEFQCGCSTCWCNCSL